MAINLKLGDKLYRRVALSGIWEYEVIERRELPEGSLYVVRSNACTHGWKCELLIGEDDFGDLRYLRMTNNDEDDDQSCWHSPGVRFCMTKAQAKIDACKLFIKEADDRIAKAKEAVIAAEKNRKQVQEMMDLALTEVEAESNGKCE